MHLGGARVGEAGVDARVGQVDMGVDKAGRDNREVDSPIGVDFPRVFRPCNRSNRPGLIENNRDVPIESPVIVEECIDLQDKSFAWNVSIRGHRSSSSVRR